MSHLEQAPTSTSQAVTDNLRRSLHRIFRGDTPWFTPSSPLDSAGAEAVDYLDVEGLPEAEAWRCYEVVPVDVDGNAAAGNARAALVRYSLPLPFVRH